MTPKQLNEIEARAQLCAEATLPGEQLRALLEHIQQLQQAAQEAARALDRLARLGNEPMMGNSNGNVMAQQALAALKHAGVML